MHHLPATVVTNLFFFLTKRIRDDMSTDAGIPKARMRSFLFFFLLSLHFWDGFGDGGNLGGIQGYQGREAFVSPWLYAMAA